MSLPQEDPRFFSASHNGWRAIGVTGLLFGLVCLVGLIAAISLKKADALADIALVLAIAAFLVQIVVSVMQNAASRQAAAESQRLNFETNAALEQIKANTKASQEVLSRQFDSLLQALIGTKGKSSDDDALELSSVSASRRFSLLDRGPSAEDQRVIERLKTWPDEEDGVRLLPILRSLSPSAVASLERYRRDEVTSRQEGRSVGLLPTDNPFALRYVQELESAALVEPGDPEEFGQGGTRLTELGREVARLLRPEGEPPAWWLRDMAEGPSLAGDGLSPSDLEQR